ALFCPPGVGKGTQAKLLVHRLGLKHISTGDLIRSAIKMNTSVGKQARSYVRAGELVPGPIVRKLAEDVMTECGTDYFILDGYPRTIEQADWTMQFLESHDAPLEAVLSIYVPDEVVVSRLSKRRINRETGEIYHLDFNPPPKSVPKDSLVQRKDDRPEAIRQRLQVYRNQTLPLEDFFSDKGLFHRIDGLGEIEVVYGRLMSVVADNVASFGKSRQLQDQS
ncbi:MAG: nucleoside monophosphate kinase, partial [Rhodothermales bacterium]|nr:nucleoside monophosphate kinase [Rhodothermales bacterium]